MVKRVSVFLVLVLLVSACASSPGGNTRGRSDVITAQEMETVNVTNLYDLIQRLRPRWLDVRSRQSFNSVTSIVVYQGQSFLGGVDQLRQMGVELAYRIKYLDGATASATLPGIGTRQVEAAIIVNPLN